MLVINTIKHAVGRPRPFLGLSDVHLLVGKGSSGSMPSSHASSWFAAAFLGYVYYRRSWLFLLPLALTIGFSRIYLGVHYPSDVLAGAILGMGYAAVGLITANALWRRVGADWFPGWWAQMPSLLNPVIYPPKSPTPPHQPSTLNPQLSTNSEWLHLGYLVIAVVLLCRLGYLAGGKIELSEDEAYQWVWSKHLALSYYSKPPLIACVQFLGTRLWGDTEFGVRFFFHR